MKILFVSLPNPLGVWVNRDYCGGFGSAFPVKKGVRRQVWPPLFDAYAAAVLIDQSFDVRIVDAVAEGFSTDQLLHRVKEENPEIVVGRISLPAFDNDVKVMGEIKQAVEGATLIGWGSICKVEAETSLAKSKLDIVIRDELEFVIPEVAKKLQTNEGLTAVKGISFKSQDKIIHNPDRPFEKNLDILPIPAYYLLPMEKYVSLESHFVQGGSKSKEIPFFVMLASRGCSFNCMYCPYPAIFGPWRGRSPGRVVDEMEILASDYKVQAIWFHDQTFSMFPEQAAEICDDIVKRKINVHWACETRADKLPSSLVKKMKRAGCSIIQVGVETGDTELVEKVGKRGNTIGSIEDSLRRVQNEGISLITNFIVGLPDDSWKTIQNTARFIKRMKPDDVAISLLTPYPGTPFFDKAASEGWLVSTDWNNYSTTTPVICQPNFSENDMLLAKEYLLHVAYSSAASKKIVQSFKKRQIEQALKAVGLTLPLFGKTLYCTAKVKIHKLFY